MTPLSRSSTTREITATLETYVKRDRERLPRWTFLAGANESRTLIDLYAGCLLWGAVGDALGRPFEGKAETRE